MTRSPVTVLQRRARERADEQSRRIPWQRLHETRTLYLEWHEFCLWFRSIVEIEAQVPDPVRKIMDARCPGFLAPADQAAQIEVRPLALRLEDWLEDQVFRAPREEGWWDAVAYYAVRDPRYQRAQVCWSECVEKWKHAKPIRYPSLEEWRMLAAAADETAHLLPRERKARTSVKRVERDRLAAALDRYLEWEALAYWARPALERGAPMPGTVTGELESRCPGFLATIGEASERGSTTSSWDGLMGWITEHDFADAKAEGWLDAILLCARDHPRAVRTLEYADHCDELRGAGLPSPYPSFETWRGQADSYVETSLD